MDDIRTGQGAGLQLLGERASIRHGEQDVVLEHFKPLKFPDHLRVAAEGQIQLVVREHFGQRKGPRLHDLEPDAGVLLAEACENLRQDVGI